MCVATPLICARLSCKFVICCLRRPSWRAKILVAAYFSQNIKNKKKKFSCYTWEHDYKWYKNLQILETSHVHLFCKYALTLFPILSAVSWISATSFPSWKYVSWVNLWRWMKIMWIIHKISHYNIPQFVRTRLHVQCLYCTISKSLVNR